VARPTRSRPLYVQMIGHGTRLYPCKDDYLILHLVGVTTRHDLMTAASLFSVESKPDQTIVQPVRERETAARIHEEQETAREPEVILTSASVRVTREYEQKRGILWTAWIRPEVERRIRTISDCASVVLQVERPGVRGRSQDSSQR
jgi:superfamily II DNA or RNA helicase